MLTSEDGSSSQPFLSEKAEASVARRSSARFTFFVVALILLAKEFYELHVGDDCAFDRSTMYGAVALLVGAVGLLEWCYLILGAIGIWNLPCCALLLALVVILLLIARAPLRRHLTTNVSRTPLQNSFYDLIQKNGSDGCGVVCVKDSQGVTRQSHAVGNLSSWSRHPADMQTRFEIASVSKIAVSFEVMQLIEEGRLHLGQRLDNTPLWEVTSWPDNWGPQKAEPMQSLGQTTIQQLLQHTSGLPDFWDDGPESCLHELAKDMPRPSFLLRPLSATWCALLIAALGSEVRVNKFTFEAIVRPLITRDKLEQIWDPKFIVAIALNFYSFDQHLNRGQFKYADLNYILLGMLLEALHQETLAKLLQRRVFGPLHMSDTYVRYQYQTQTDHGEGDKSLSTRYCNQGFLGRFAWTFDDFTMAPIPFLTMPTRYSSADWASGGVVSTADDLCMLLLALTSAHKHIWERMTKSAVTRHGNKFYGFGLEINRLGDECTLIGHTGDGGAAVFYWQERGIVFGGTTNNNHSNLRDYIFQEIQSGSYASQ